MNLREAKELGRHQATRPGYMGSSETIDDAICEFAVEYADQAQRDYRTFVKAVREGRVKATIES